MCLLTWRTCLTRSGWAAIAVRSRLAGTGALWVALVRLAVLAIARDLNMLKKPAATIEVLPRQLSCAQCPFLTMSTFRRFTPEELQFVTRLKLGEVRLKAGETVLVEGQDSPYLYTVLSGWLFKSKSLDSGRRQIINYAVPGDLVGLQSAVFDKMQHSVEALGDAVLCVFPKHKIWTLYKQHQGLGFDLTWIAAQEKSILADFLVSVGQRTAAERIAFLLLTLFRRARAVGLVRKQSVRFPFTQEHFADTIGFSLVHTNKRISRLKRTGAFEWTTDNFRMIDEDLLSQLAGQPTFNALARPFI